MTSGQYRGDASGSGGTVGSCGTYTNMYCGVSAGRRCDSN